MPLGVKLKMEEARPIRVRDAVHSLGVPWSGERARLNFSGEVLTCWYRHVEEVEWKLGETILECTPTDSAVRGDLEALVNLHGPKIWCENPTCPRLKVGDDIGSKFFKFELVYPRDTER